MLPILIALLATPGTAEAKKPAATEEVCRMETATNTRFPKRVCRTRKAMSATADGAAAEVQALQSPQSVNVVQ